VTSVSEFLDAIGRPNIYEIPPWVVAYSLTKTSRPHAWYLVRLDAEGEPVEVLDASRPSPASAGVLRLWMVDKGVPSADAAALAEKIASAPPPLAAWSTGE
jgi:hypothetical protein